MDNNIGNNIRKLRTERNLTQRELSDKSKISLSAINKYERGDRIPKFETIEKLSDALNVQIDYILGRSKLKRMYSQIMQDDVSILINKTDNGNKEISKLTSGIVDIMYLTINGFIDDNDIESLTIIHSLYREIWRIKMLKSNFVADDLQNVGINTKEESYGTYKKQINILIEEFYKNINNNQTNTKNK